MSDFENGYRAMLFEREFPRPEPAPETKAAAPAAEGKPAGRGPDAKGGAEVPAMALMDTMAGLLKGSVAATLGLPGDVESLVRLLSGGKQVLPTTEDVQGMLPAVVPDGGSADRKHTANISETLGEFLPLAPVAAARKVVGSAVTKLSELPPGPASGGPRSQIGAVGSVDSTNAARAWANPKEWQKRLDERLAEQESIRIKEILNLSINESRNFSSTKKDIESTIGRKLSKEESEQIKNTLGSARKPPSDRVIRYDSNGKRVEASQ